MKILMMGWGFPPKIQGGLDIHVYEICKELAKRNDVMLTLPEFNSPKKAPDGIKVIPIKCPKFSDLISLIRSVREYNRNIVKVCKNLHFDVIHSHDWFGVEASARLKAKAPWVLTIHSLEYMRSCHRGKSVMDRLERKGMGRCDRIVAVSGFMKREIAKSGVNQGKIDVVYNSARVDRGEPGKIRRKFGLGRRPVVLYLGRLSQQKGVEYVINSAKIVSEKIPEARFLIAGEGHLRKCLESFSGSLGLEGKVFFAGFVPDKELASYYSAADIFVSPSFYEPFGITALESLLSGTPAIVGKDSGVLERIPGMECVLAVKPGNSRDLAEKIMHILERRTRVLEADKKLLRKAYSWKESAIETEKIYLKVAKDLKGRRPMTPSVENPSFQNQKLI
jgi:glycosyltransferase involved in cell wall biosynthesis